MFTKTFLSLSMTLKVSLSIWLSNHQNTLLTYRIFHLRQWRLLLTLLFKKITSLNRSRPLMVDSRWQLLSRNLIDFLLTMMTLIFIRKVDNVSRRLISLHWRQYHWMWLVLERMKEGLWVEVLLRLKYNCLNFISKSNEGIVTSNGYEAS